jgi:alpha-tubulin suppressor-like RCC1 family protein
MQYLWRRVSNCMCVCLLVSAFGCDDGRGDSASDAGMRPRAAGRSAGAAGSSAPRSGGERSDDVAGRGGAGGKAAQAGMDAGDPIEDAGASSTAIPVALSSGDTSTMLLYSNGEVRLFGKYENNRICDPVDGDADVIVAGTADKRALTGALGVENGADTACIIYADTTVACCGSNTQGQRGTPESSGGGHTRLSVMTAAGMELSGVTQVSLAHTHACALLGEGAVWCWGDDLHGALGVGEISYMRLPVQPLAVGGQGPMMEAKEIAVGTLYSCAVQGDGTVACWGDNTLGQLGINTFTQEETLASTVQVEDGGPLRNAVDVEASSWTTCALDADGVVWCWGSNRLGELGAGAEEKRAFAAPVLDTSGQTLRAKRISVAGEHACALLEGGRVSCWGANTTGQVGDGTTQNAKRATPVPDLADAVAISTGGDRNNGEFSCALWADGEVKCWGATDRGQFGATLPGAYSLVPITIQGL